MNLTPKHIILTFLAIFFIAGQAGYCQTPELNEEKYWEYRERLKNEFMTGVGPDMGMSIPASVRDTASGLLQWTDCTMAHGEYLAVLAMEYRILDERSDDTEETIEELFYALYALNRLDYAAEPFFGGTASLNGFFIRDDISEDSLDMESVLEHLNAGLPQYKIFGLYSDYMNAEPRNNEESLDQAILLITGLGMVSKCIPEDVVYNKGKNIQEFQDFETSLSLEARNIIKRIVNYMKEGDSVRVSLSPSDPNLYGIEGEAWDFIIKNPVSYEPVLRGENAFFLSKGFSSAKYHFTGILSETTDSINDMLSDSIFLLFEDYIVPNDQDFKTINLNAMANFWPDGLQEDSSNTEYNARILGPRAKDQDYEWIPMLQQIIFDGPNNYLMSELPPDTAFYNDPKGYYEYLLNLAPPEGPYNYGGGNYPNWEWSSTSRSIQPGRRGETNNAFPGNYDGLDYMLYYNMYTLLFSGSVSVWEETIIPFRAFPNPFSERITINATGVDGQLKFELIGMEGKVHSYGLFETQTSISTASLKEGIYLLRISDKEQHQTTQKIIKKQF